MVSPIGRKSTTLNSAAQKEYQTQEQSKRCTNKIAQYRVNQTQPKLN